jgi:hypothetical protein
VSADVATLKARYVDACGYILLVCAPDRPMRAATTPLPSLLSYEVSNVRVSVMPSWHTRGHVNRGRRAWKSL